MLPVESRKYKPGTVLGKAWADFMTDPENEQIIKRIFALNMNGDNTLYEFRLKPQRAEKYAQYEKVNSWENDMIYCLREGDTLVFVFNNYVKEAVSSFKWLLDYAKENGIKTLRTRMSSTTSNSPFSRRADPTPAASCFPLSRRNTVFRFSAKPAAAVNVRSMSDMLPPPHTITFRPRSS